MNLHTWIHMVVTLGLLFSPWAGGLRLGQPVEAAPAAATWYVKPGENGTCTSWADACELQAALGMAVPGDEVWVAAGTYLPDYDPIGGTHIGDRTASFQLQNGVAVYGGFPGTEEPGFGDRDWETYLTILSGDIGTPSDSSDNSYHVVASSGVTETAVLDGFTISNGHADGADPNDRGGGMRNDASSPTVINTIFSNNRAGYGGGMFNHGSSPALTNVTFVDNGADPYDGGGMNNASDSNPVLTNVAFSRNTAARWGGGMSNGQSSPMLTNVTFFENTADPGTGSGGGIYNWQSEPALANCILWGNEAPDGAQIYNIESTPTISHSDIEDSGGSLGWDGGLGTDGGGNLDANPRFVDAAGGDLRLVACSPATEAGDNSALDLNGDGDPYNDVLTDLGGHARFVDLPLRPDTGSGTAPVVDMGAYEAQLPGAIFVDANAAGANSGGSWTHAFTDLQDALSCAYGVSLGGEVWVAVGTYKPSYQTIGFDPRTATFQLYSGVEIYGGFAGTETSRDQRNPDPAINNTVLSGDIGNPEDSTDNSYHVVTGSGTDATAVLDGFTVSGGNANRYGSEFMMGAGMFNSAGSPTLANLAFSSNTAASSGGGMENRSGSSPTLTDITFSGNSAFWGAGMNNSESDPTLASVTFSGNSADDRGGGMYNTGGSSPSLTDVDFMDNTAVYEGGGMCNEFSSPVLTGGTFSGNTASLGGGMYNNASSPTLGEVTFDGNGATIGGGMHNSGSGPTLTGVTFSGNSADGSGGGMYNSGSSPILMGGTFSDNSASYGGGICNRESSPTLTGVTFSGNSASYGGGMDNYASSPTLDEVTFDGNGASMGGGMRNSLGSPTLTSVTFSGNSADGSGGGMYNEGSSPILMGGTFSGNTANEGGGMYNEGGSPTLTTCTFSGNTASEGGGMYNWQVALPEFTETHFFGNSALYGGAMYNSRSSLHLDQILLSGNEAGDSGGGMYNHESSLELTNVTFSANEGAVDGGGLANVNGSDVVVANSLLWGTAASPGAQVSSDVSSTVAISYSLVQGGYPGPGNLDADPQFADADGPDDVVGTPDDDLHLTCASPALDGGDNSAVPAGVTTDLDGLPRFRGLGEPVVAKPPVDMGPYEEQDYGDWVSAGYTHLHEGQAYRTGFHVEPAKTIQATIDVYEEGPFLQASDQYSRALTCAPTAERRTEAGTGLLDARWELATGGMLLGNEATVQTLDMRYAAQSGLVDQIDKLEEARENYITATVAYLDLLPGDVYTVAMDLQPSRNTPLDGSSAAYADVQRLAEAAARKSRATLEIAERQFRLYTPAGKVAAEDTLRQGFDQATAELALLDHLAAGWAEPTTAYLNAYQALTQDLADMQRLFGYLKEGKNPFGYAEQYVPFMPIELGVQFPDPNFERWYDRAMTDDWVGYDKAKQEYDELMAQQRDLDDDETALGTAMGLLDGKYRERLVEICGSDGTEPDLAGCHRNEAGTMDDQFYAIFQAESRAQKVRLQMEDQVALFRIEQQRAAQVAGIHRATAVMYTETGEELASLAQQEVELQQADSWMDNVGGVFGNLATGMKGGSAFGPEGALVGGVIGLAMGAATVVGKEASTTGADLADIAEKREEIKACRQARVEYAEAEVEDANSEALIKQYMLEYAELKLDLAIAINQFQQELARLEGMKAQVEYLLARWNEARRTATELYRDPGARVVRDMYAEEARQYFEAALESAYLAGRALDYEMAEQWPGEGDVYGLVVPEGTGNLEGHLGDMWTTYQSWYQVSPQQRDTAIKLSEAMGLVDSWEMVGGVPQWVTAEEKFNRYVSDPGNWVDRDNDGTPESLELVFQTTLFADPPQFFSNNVYNDKIRYFYIVLWGDESALDPDGNDTYVMLRQEGTSFVRDEDARPLAGNDSYREYNLEPTRNYSPKAIYNREPDFDGDQIYRSLGLYWRSVACTKWVLTIDREGEPTNDDLDLDALEEIEVYISQRNFPLLTRSAADGEAGPSSPGAGPAIQPSMEVSASDDVASGSLRVSLPSLTAAPEAARRFAGTVILEQPQRLPSLELALRLEETGGTVTGAVEADGLLGYPILDAQTGFGPVLHGTVQEGKYVLISDPFVGAGGMTTRRVVLTTTSATDSTISGEYVETIQGLTPQDLEIRGVYTLTRSLDRPLASFSATPGAGPATLNVAFHDWSLGGPTSWLWDFGDGATSPEQHPIHAYDQPGLYTVSLTVSNLFGTHTLTETGYISVTEPAAPVAYFAASPRSGAVPLTVAFQDQSAGSPTSWAWSFGDGDTSTAKHPSHTYDQPGSYTVALTVTNQFGTDTLTEPDYILVTEPLAPVAHFSAEPTSGTAPLKVFFTDQSTNDPTAWAWDFGDGGASAVQHPTYTYLTDGTFTVTLTVSNAIGSDMRSVPDYITVEGAERIYLPLVTRNAP